jgi:HEAT repeat protein
MATDIPQLIVTLGDVSPAERSRAAEQLCHLGAEAQEAAVALARASADDAEEVREWAVAALEDIGAPAAADLDALTVLLADKNRDVGYWAATLLGRLGSQAAAAVPALAGALTGPVDLAVRQRAAWALGQIGPSAAAARTPLQQAAHSDDPRLARLAQQVLQQIGG